MKVQTKFQRAGEKKRKECLSNRGKNKIDFFFVRDFFYIVQGKKCGPRRKHAKKAKNEKKADKKSWEAR